MENGQQLQVNIKKQVNLEKLLLKSKRRSKRAEIKESFSCQCGKIYLSFSALYLHAKNKHKFKLTTKLNDEVCQIERSQGLIKYIYNLSEIQVHENEKPNQKNSKYLHLESEESQKSKKKQTVSLEQKWVQYFQEYFQKIKSETEENIVKQFVRFAQDDKKETNLPLVDQIKQIPHLYNKFMLDYVPINLGQEIYSNRWRQICTFIQKLHEWIYQSGYTDLLIINQV